MLIKICNYCYVFYKVKTSEIIGNFNWPPRELLIGHRHAVNSSLDKLLANSEIVISATGGTVIQVKDILNARDGIILASAGSKLQEIDVAGLKSIAQKSRKISDNMVEYILPSGKRVCILCDGAAVNFLLGSCPDQTMDLVFSEIIKGCQMLMNGDILPSRIHNVSEIDQQEIATSWLRLHSP